MKLVLVVHSGPDESRSRLAEELADAALGRGDQVTIFAMAGGIANLTRASFVALAGKGAQLTVCDHNRAEWQAPEGIDGVNYGSQYDLAGYVADADRVVSFI